MDEYRARHAAKYQERVRQQEEEEEAWQRVQGSFHAVGAANGVQDMTARLQYVLDTLHTHLATRMTHDSEVRALAMDMLVAVNANPTVRISMEQRDQGTTLQRLVKEILCGVGVLAEGEEDLGLEYVMDCEGDEALARRLAAEEEEAVETRRAPGRPRRRRQDPPFSSATVHSPSENVAVVEPLPEPVRKKVVKKRGG